MRFDEKSNFFQIPIMMNIKFFFISSDNFLLKTCSFSFTIIYDYFLVTY